jgi:Tol biopolymer transport system component
MRTTPLTSFKGVEIFPAFSPDGNQVAFVWNGETGDNDDIYLKMIGTDSALRLTHDPGDDFSPTWSPDGRHIAFLRRFKDESAIYTIPALGGAERKLYAAHAPMCLRWTPEGKYLAFSESLPPAPRRIYLLSVETLEPRQLTSMSEPAGADTYFAFSPDGSTLAFVRATSTHVADIYLVSTASGEPQRLTFDNQTVYGLDWTRDGQHIVFASPRGGDYRLWKVPIAGGEPEMLFAGGEGVYFPAIAPQGNRLAYMQQQFEDTNIWQIEMLSPTGPAGQPTQLAFSTRWEEGPHFSPDGQRIAFISLRSGSREVWVCHRDGSSPFKLTAMGGQHTSTPRWSPDGRQIAFDSRPDGYADIYVINVDGGLPYRLTTDPGNDEAPSWSHDGKWVYFRSKRSGSWQVWKVPVEGGEAVQVTKSEGIAAFESTNGRYVYSMKWRTPGIWRMPVEGGEEAQILDRPTPRFWGYWAVSDQGLYFANDDDKGDPVIEFYDFASRRVTRLATLDKKNWTGLLQTGLTVSPDGQTLLYVQQDGNEGDIILVENFR